MLSNIMRNAPLICVQETRLLPVFAKEKAPTYSGDTYFRLYLGDVEVAFNDNYSDEYCDKGSQITYYAVAETCTQLVLRQGYSDYYACSGTTEVSYEGSK
jgi:hypothetical protein